MNRTPAVRVVATPGDTDLDAALAAAADLDPFKERQHLCEARFFGAELKLASGAKDDAERLFRLAAACPKAELHWGATNEELRALRAGAVSKAGDQDRRPLRRAFRPLENRHFLFWNHKTCYCSFAG